MQGERRRSQLDTFRLCTGRAGPPAERVDEAWLICVRRASKSLVLALVAVFMACFRDWSPHLAPGERGTIKVIACNREQARVIYRSARALITRGRLDRRTMPRQRGP
jgi:hypothetical protein